MIWRSPGFLLSAEQTPSEKSPEKLLGWQRWAHGTCRDSLLKRGSSV